MPRLAALVTIVGLLLPSTAMPFGQESPATTLDPAMMSGVIASTLAANRITGSDAVSVSVSPTVAREPARITIRVSVEPDPDNRALDVISQSENFFRRSYRQLEGERSARTSVFEYNGLPAGDYDIRAVLIAADGRPGAIAVAKMKIRP